MKIITSVRYLARQGLALRGHEHDEGNLEELLNLREAECPDLKVWRNTRYKKFTSWTIQNELLQLMTHSVVRQLCANIVKAGSFALVVDGIKQTLPYKNKNPSLYAMWMRIWCLTKFSLASSLSRMEPQVKH